MQVRRSRFLAGVATGAGVTAIGASLVLGSPSGATPGALPTSSFVRPVLLAHGSRGVEAMPAGFLAEGESSTVGAGAAGGYVVQRAGDALVITSATPAAGWTVDVKWNDNDVVKAVFTGPTSKIKAVAELGRDGVLSIGVAEEALPPPPPPAPAPKAAKVAAAQAFGGDGDVDGKPWCGDGHDGDFDGRGASFDGDHDGDWHDKEHDGDWHGKHHDDHDGDRRDGRRGDGRRRH
ncbi:MAG TPA: hypothetical protein VEA78_02295 [Acidimicrobiales bacterium]|nr:hypothetical protein [Acidimicrobiales bacterium]